LKKEIVNVDLKRKVRERERWRKEENDEYYENQRSEGANGAIQKEAGSDSISSPLNIPPQTTLILIIGSFYFYPPLFLSPRPLSLPLSLYLIRLLLQQPSEVGHRGGLHHPFHLH